MKCDKIESVGMNYDSFTHACEASKNTGTLVLSAEKLTDSDLQIHVIPFLMENKNVINLNVRFNNITDCGAIDISRMTHLRKVLLLGNEITRMGVLYITCRNPECEIDMHVPSSSRPQKSEQDMNNNVISINKLKVEIKELQKEIRDEIERIHESVQEFEEMLDAFHEHFWSKSKEMMACIENIECGA